MPTTSSGGEVGAFGAGSGLEARGQSTHPSIDQLIELPNPGTCVEMRLAAATASSRDGRSAESLHATIVWASEELS